jgi:dTDP-4-amino-4,6-dideoxygalactose transaminase
MTAGLSLWRRPALKKPGAVNVNIPLVDLKAQYRTIAAEVGAAMQEVLDRTCFILGPPLEAFEKAFAAYCQAKHCIGVASGTDAIHLMLRAAGVGPGDEVLVPAMTFVATALGVTQADAEPVLVDVKPTDALMDPSAVDAAITPRTKAILAVHLYGRCADMDALRAIADHRGLLLFEDAAQAHGAEYRGRRAGSLARAAAFSFYPGKNLGAYGDGGAITTDDDALADRLRLLRNWGSRRKYYHEEFGLNSRLDTLQAAILNVKLKYLDDWNAARRRHAAAYDRLLASHDQYYRPQDDPADKPVYHLYVLRCRQRDAKLTRLEARGIAAGIHYPFPLHRLQAYRHLDRAGSAFPHAEALAAECLSLPMYPELTADQIAQVVDHLVSAD